VFNNAISVLPTEDQDLPAVRQMLPLLQRGVGVHHSGLLPILKELIEILFQEGLLKVLFATETFAMGLNMPARTVVFTATHKWDGEANRAMHSGEYIQMSGRAGRRGKDSKGIVIVMVNEEMTMEACKEMMLGKPAPLESSFRLTYYALLNLMARAEGQFNAEHVIAHSFHQFQHDRQVPEVEKRIKQLQAEADALEAGTEGEIREYHALRLSLAEKERRLKAEVLRPDRCLHFLQPGRLIRVVDGLDDWGWGVIVNVMKQPSQSNTKSAVIAPSPTASAAATAPLSTTAYLVDTLLLCSPVVDSGGADGSTAQLVPRPCALDGNGEMHVIPVKLPAVARIGALRIALPTDLRPKEARQAVLVTLRDVTQRFPDGLPILDPVEDMGIMDESFLDLVHSIDKEESKLATHPLFKAEIAEQKLEVLKRRGQLLAEAQRLKMKTRESQLSLFKSELRNRSRVLKRLGHIDADGVVQLKGRAACVVTTGDELLVTELMLEGAFNSMDPHQLVAVASCFLPSEKSNEEQPVAADLKPHYNVLREAAQHIARVQIEEKIEVDEEEYVDQFRPTLMNVFYQWSKGESFGKVIDSTDVFEGTIVRVARRLDELLNE
ncbi:unnamed protein product, partial [Closterium sp. NIES-53]